MTTTSAAQKLSPQVKEIERPDYTWKKLYNLWTTDPSKAVFFPAKVVNGEEWSATYITEVEHTDVHGITSNHRVRLYGDLAERANEMLKAKGQTALIRAEGHVRQESWEDEQGRPHSSHSTVVKQGRLQILDMQPFTPAIDMDPDVDPFAMFAPATTQDQGQDQDQMDSEVQVEEAFVEHEGDFNIAEMYDEEEDRTSLSEEAQMDQAPF